MGSVFQFQLRDSVSDFSKRRRLRLMGQLANVCPHIDQFVVNEDGGGTPVPHLRFAFRSPSGTIDWYCEMCEQWLSQDRYEAYRRHVEQGFQSDPSGTLKQLDADRTKANKLITKINRLGGAP